MKPPRLHVPTISGRPRAGKKIRMQSMDTIAAVATPLGTGGIGVVRLSGPEAAAVADRVVRLAGEKTVAGMKGYTCAYGRAGDADGEIDEAVVTLFRAPRSFTGEEVVEIAVHGGVYLVNRLLRACVAAGARPALAGEFTRRAFLNGKLDLTQAEAVADLISAEGRQAARAALSARDGALYRRAEAVAVRPHRLRRPPGRVDRLSRGGDRRGGPGRAGRGTAPL